MSTSGVSSSTSSSATNQGFQLVSLGNGSQLQVTGLASGINTDQIVQGLMSIYEQPVTHLTNQQTALKAKDAQLTSIQKALQQVAADAQTLGDPSLFADTQTVTSTNTTLVGATATSSGVGAVVGGYEVAVNQLATAAQSTYSFTSPGSADAITIDGQQVSVSAGETIQSFVNSINNNSNLDVYATATNSSTVVLSSRTTGSSGSITVGDPGGTLAFESSQAGQDAKYSINGGPTQTSGSNTVASAIPGVTLSLNGLTTTGPVTVNVGAPGPSSQNIASTLNQFISDYNSAVSMIQTQLAQQPSSSDQTQGTLFGDLDLTELLRNMRTAMDSTLSGLANGMNNMLDIGVNTGAASGTATPSQSSIDGALTLSTSTLLSALATNASGTQHVLLSWSIQFTNLVNNEAAAGGALDARIQSDSTRLSNLGSQIANMESALADKQNSLTQEFAQMEAALSQNQSTSSWLTSTIAQLP
jgi:flagellar hook-associated protein 2